MLTCGILALWDSIRRLFLVAFVIRPARRSVANLSESVCVCVCIQKQYRLKDIPSDLDHRVKHKCNATYQATLPGSKRVCTRVAS
jgi:hypothetical protein